MYVYLYVFCICLYVCICIYAHTPIKHLHKGNNDWYDLKQNEIKGLYMTATSFIRGWLY